MERIKSTRQTRRVRQVGSVSILHGKLSGGNLSNPTNPTNSYLKVRTIYISTGNRGVK